LPPQRIDEYINMKEFFRPLALVYSYITQGSRSSSGSKHFSYEKVLPPLPKLEPNTKYGKSIPVLYTNNPSSACRWIEEHISDCPVAVGWDVEVSLSQSIPLFLGMLNVPHNFHVMVLSLSLISCCVAFSPSFLVNISLLRIFLGEK
jgi:hypothetical protein